MRNGKCVNADVSNFKAVTRGKQSGVNPHVEQTHDFVACGAIAIDRNVESLGDPDQALNMITVFVSDEDGGQVFWCAPNAGKALTDLAWAKSGIYEHARFVGFHIGTIPR